MINVNDKDLGLVTAYAYAVSKGYEGTEEEFAQLMANYATVGQTATEAAEQAASSAEASGVDSLKSEGYSVGKQSGEDVEEGSPYYHNNAKYYAEQASDSATTASNKAGEASESAGTATDKASEASGSATSAATDALKSEGFAVGKQDGTAVASGSPYYQNNSKYYSEQSAASATAAGNAQTAAETAQGKAETAQGKAEDAQEAAEAAQAAAEEAAQTLVLDDTLTQPNQAAQAKAVGDALEDKAPIILSTSSGSIASFSDGANNLPVKNLIAEIVPKQDLHGYDNPWPAGGGANIWDEQWEVGSYDNDSGEKISASLMRSKNAIPVEPSNIYRITAITGGMWVGFYAANSAFMSYINVSTGSTFTAPDGCYFVRFHCYSGYGTTYKNDIAINYPATVTTYSPYSNICPITGWDGCEVVRCGKNQAKISNDNIGSHQKVDITYTSTGCSLSATGSYSRAGWLFPVVIGETYTISFKGQITQTGTDDQNKIVLGSKDGAWTITADGFIKSIGLETTLTQFSYTFTAVSDVLFFGAYITSTGSTKGVTISDIQLELGSTTTAYEPYHGSTYPISWQSSAGTVYGGRVNVTTGELVVDRAVVDLGTLTWLYSSSYGGFFVSSGIADIVADTYICLSSIYKNIPLNSSAITDNNCSICINANGAGGGITGAAGFKNIVVTNRDYTSASVFKTAMSGVQLCYKLATPLTYTLTPTEVKTLLGQNNIWADCGDTEVEYRADTKLYIERLTEPTEDDMIADHAIASGAFFMIGNSLYRATTAIASGATIIVGTNATKLSLADALNTLS